MNDNTHRNRTFTSAYPCVSIVSLQHTNCRELVNTMSYLYPNQSISKSVVSFVIAAVVIKPH